MRCMSHIDLVSTYKTARFALLLVRAIHNTSLDASVKQKYVKYRNCLNIKRLPNLMLADYSIEHANAQKEAVRFDRMRSITIATRLKYTCEPKPKVKTHFNNHEIQCHYSLNTRIQFKHRNEIINTMLQQEPKIKISISLFGVRCVDCFHPIGISIVCVLKRWQSALW